MEIIFLSFVCGICSAINSAEQKYFCKMTGMSLTVTGISVYFYLCQISKKKSF